MKRRNEVVDVVETTEGQFSEPSDRELISAFADRSKAKVQVVGPTDQLRLIQEPKYASASYNSDFSNVYGGADKFSTANELWLACAHYFMWCDKHPLEIFETLRSGAMAGTVVPRPVLRPFILEEMLNHIGIGIDTWNLYKGSAYRHMNPVTEVAENYIKARKLTGAYTGQYNAVIAQREMNMVEKIQTETHAVVEHKVTGMRIIESE